MYRGRVRSILVYMRKHTRSLILGASAIVAFSTLSACSGSSTTEANPSPSSAPATTAVTDDFPDSARYIADMPMKDGKTMTLGVAVDGEKVVAYACDGSKDEAWFFGKQDNGALDITGKFQDTLKAEVAGTDGNTVEGDLTMDGVAYHFSAPQVADPAGMYTAELDGVRASWVVRSDNTATGVQFNGGITGRDFEQAELQQLKDVQFRNSVRNKRILQQAAQLQLGSFTSTINGKPVTAKLVTGNTTFG
ncbi:hypothetical protein BH09ACT7_BH09ACT7_29140 [soil metagenome]